MLPQLEHVIGIVQKTNKGWNSSTREMRQTQKERKITKVSFMCYGVFLHSVTNDKDKML